MTDFKRQRQVPLHDGEWRLKIGRNGRFYFHMKVGEPYQADEGSGYVCDVVQADAPDYQGVIGAVALPLLRHDCLYVLGELILFIDSLPDDVYRHAFAMQEEYRKSHAVVMKSVRAEKAAKELRRALAAVKALEDEGGEL